MCSLCALLSTACHRVLPCLLPSCASSTFFRHRLSKQSLSFDTFNPSGAGIWVSIPSVSPSSFSLHHHYISWLEATQQQPTSSPWIPALYDPLWWPVLPAITQTTRAESSPTLMQGPQRRFGRFLPLFYIYLGAFPSLQPIPFLASPSLLLVIYIIGSGPNLRRLSFVIGLNLLALRPRGYPSNCARSPLSLMTWPCPETTLEDGYAKWMMMLSWTNGCECALEYAGLDIVLMNPGMMTTHQSRCLKASSSR
jgi:hypothetical protein